MIAKIAYNYDTVIFQNLRQRSRANSSVRLFLDIKTALFYAFTLSLLLTALKWSSSYSEILNYQLLKIEIDLWTVWTDISFFLSLLTLIASTIHSSGYFPVFFGIARIYFSSYW